MVNLVLATHRAIRRRRDSVCLNDQSSVDISSKKGNSNNILYCLCILSVVSQLETTVLKLFLSLSMPEMR